MDFLWPAQRLIVELDGYASHGTRASFERDRARDRLLAVSGYRTVRVTWSQLHDGAAALERDLRTLLCDERGALSAPPAPVAGGPRGARLRLR